MTFPDDMPIQMRIEAEISERGLALDSDEALEIARSHYRDYVPTGVDLETVKVDDDCIELNARYALKFIAERRN